MGVAFWEFLVTLFNSQESSILVEGVLIAMTNMYVCLQARVPTSNAKLSSLFPLWLEHINAYLVTSRLALRIDVTSVWRRVAFSHVCLFAKTRKFQLPALVQVGTRDALKTARLGDISMYFENVPAATDYVLATNLLNFLLSSSPHGKQVPWYGIQPLTLPPYVTFRFLSDVV